MRPVFVWGKRTSADCILLQVRIHSHIQRRASVRHPANVRIDSHLQRTVSLQASARDTTSNVSFDKPSVSRIRIKAARECA